jgi:hypothetical protein
MLERAIPMRSAGCEAGMEPEPLEARIRYGSVVGVLISSVLGPVHDVATNRIPLGMADTAPPAAMVTLLGSLAVGLVIGLLPRPLRRVGLFAVLGAFVGLVASLIHSRLMYGLGVADTYPDFLRGMGEDLGVRTPLGTAVGAVFGLAYGRLTSSSPAGSKKRASRPDPTAGVWDREIDLIARARVDRRAGPEP